MYNINDGTNFQDNANFCACIIIEAFVNICLHVYIMRAGHNEQNISSLGYALLSLMMVLRLKNGRHKQNRVMWALNILVHVHTYVSKTCFETWN